jgi:ribosomal protein L23
MKGKTVQAVRGRRRAPGIASRKDTKKAYVSLAEGTIAIFKEGEEA